MRRIGNLSHEAQARQFCDYLVTISIDAIVEADFDESDPKPSDAGWNIWVRDESRVQEAKQAFEAFQSNPEDSRYQVTNEADRIREQRVDEHLQSSQVHRPNPKPAASPTTLRQDFIPVTIAIIAISVIVSFGSNFGNPRSDRDPSKTTLEEKIYYGLSFVDRREYRTQGDSYASIRKGQWWRFVTPIFLHGDQVHLLFNMLWVFFLGSVVERVHGSWRFLLLIMATAIAGMLLQVSLPTGDAIPEAFQGTPFAIGASGAVYGLFGFLWIRPWREPTYPFRIVPANIILMLVWLFVCMTPIVPNVANGGHVGGLVAGIVAAFVWPRRS